MYIDVKGYEALYAVDEAGNVLSKRTGKILKASTDKYGYEMVHLRNGKNSRSGKVHRLVAIAFIPNPENKPTVDHIDGNKKDNHISNLRWATQSEQQLNAIRNGNRLDCTNRVKVAQLNKDGEVINVYASLKEAERQTGIHWTGISAVLRNKRKSAGGYRWVRFND